MFQTSSGRGLVTEGNSLNFQSSPHEPVALVGIGCRFPGGVRDAESFWTLMTSRKSGITEVPPDRWNAERFYHPDPLSTERMVTKWGGFVDQIKNFDAAFWGISPREAMRMDPQQRWLLETAWEALEDAGIPPSSLRGSSTGVFVGISANDYHSLQLTNKHHIDLHTNSGGTLSIAANRVSYMLDLKGPSVSVDTACSSALVAISLACQAIWSGKCEGALAGGANALITPNSSIGFSKAGMLSPSGQCFAFDERANGYVRGEGAGLVYLKPLSQAQRDGDRIYAVVRSAVVNQDGHTSSMTVPGVESQAALLRQAYDEAGIPPRHVDYIEAHGTGTPVGDPIECEALGQVLGADRADDQKCLMGSVKTNIGHLESASGIAGLIKAALVLHHRQIPPNQNFQKANPQIPFDALGLEVVQELRPLPSPADRLPVVSVNSFGFGGTNSHVVLEGAPPTAPRSPATPSASRAQRPYGLPVSARDQTALRDSVLAYETLLEDRTLNLADLCFSAGALQDHHSERLFFIAENAHQMRERLHNWQPNSEPVPGVIAGHAKKPPRELVFVFTGQGSQWWAMGQQLLQREPLFRRTIEQFDALFQPLSGWSIIQEMVKSEGTSQIDRTAIAQPAICALQIALVELWKSWGIVPTRVVGHSVGEVAAAYCSGALSFADTVQVIYHRSRLQDTTAGHGRMLAAGITPPEAREIIGDLADRVHITAINSPGLVTLGGDTAPLELIGARLENEGKFMRWLKVNYAFHTHQMDPIRDELRQSLATIRPRPGHIPFLSTVTGGLLPGEQLDAEYWWNNVRRPVLFEPAISKAIQSKATAFLEIGAHPSMQSSLNECLATQNAEGLVLHSLARQVDESHSLMTNLAQLHLASVPIQWAAVNQSDGQAVQLPHYPWHYESHWLDRGDATSRLQPVRFRFLHQRISAARPTWQFDADLRVFDYLQDHQIWDGVVFPAAGFVEIGLEIAGELFPEALYAVEELELVKALFVLPDAVPVVQVAYDPGDRSFQIYSRADEKQDWELHATGRLVLVAAEQPSGLAVDLDELQAGLSLSTTHSQLYSELRLLGYQFGENFSQIDHVWSESGEALAKIIVPQRIAESTGYRFHPAVLDACFQATLGTSDTTSDSNIPDFFFLPESIRRVQLYQETMPAELWAHAKLLRRDDHGILCDIFVYDSEGLRVADVLGFRSAQVEHQRSSDDIASGLYQCRWESQLLPEVPESLGSSTNDVCLIFADKTGVTAELARQLTARNLTVVQLRPGAAFRKTSGTEFVVPVDSAEGLSRALEMAIPSGRRLAMVIHCWSLDQPIGQPLDLPSLVSAQPTGVLSLLHLAQILRDTEQADTRVYVVTRDTQPALGDEKLTGLATSPVVGFLRVANNELSQFRWTQIDLSESVDPIEQSALLREITGGSEEREVALRQDRRLVNRLRPVREEDLALRPQNAVRPDGSVIPWRLQSNKPGILTSLSLNETRRREPGDDEIEVRVMAGGINFRDLMKAMGMYPGNPIDVLWFGDDFSGVVERVGKNVQRLAPGDRVTGLAPYSFRTFVTVHHRMVFQLPESISYEAAATLPTAFLTAHYALNELARMQPGEKILIHAGTGGVGQAAIQVAQRLGLEIFATAGSVEKRRLLREMGVPHVLNSRTLEFADQIMEITEGRGVDAVLNSLARDFIPKSLSVLAPFGRFLEIGKIDVYGNTRVRLKALKDNISYFVIDLAQHLSAKPRYVAAMFDELAQRFNSADYRPLPSTVFSITEVVDAFRYMGQGKHVGKNVLSFTAPEIPVAPCNEPGQLLKPDATYLISGGAGGFGWDIAKWMVSEGARHLALMSRSGPRAEIADELAQLRASGVTVMDLRADVANPQEVRLAIDKVSKELPPLRGVVHAAMVLDDAFIHELDRTRFSDVLNPKMLGGWNLHVATEKMPLDHFVCFSSVSALIGTVRQSNYSAANSFLDALATFRQARGLPALTVNWGAIGGAGYLERNLKAKEYLHKVGLRELLVPEAVKALHVMMQRRLSQVGVAKADWDQLAQFSPALKSCPIYSPLFQEKSRRQAGGSVATKIRNAAPHEQVSVIEEFLADQVAKVFGIEASQVDRETPLTHLGLDSLMAVDLMNRLQSELSLSIPMGSVLSGPNVQQLSTTLLGLVVAQSSPAETSNVASRGTTRTVSQLSHAIRKSHYPLTQSQQDCLSSTSSRLAANLSCVVRVSSGLDPQRLRDALTALVRNHPLMTARLDRFSRPPQIVLQKLQRIELGLHNCQQLASDRLNQQVTEGRDHEFDLDHGPLARCSLYRVDEGDDLLLLSVHPLVADEWSVTLLLRDLLRSAQSTSVHPLSGEEPAYSFQDFAEWQQAHLSSDAAERMVDFWIDQVDNTPVGLQWPAELPAKRMTSGQEGVMGFTWPKEQTLSLMAFAAEQRIPVSDVVFAAYTLTLHRFCKQADLLVGYVFDGREQPQTNEIVGSFSNCLPLRSSMEPGTTYQRALNSTRKHLSAARGNQSLPFSRLLSRVDWPPRHGKLPRLSATFASLQFPAIDDSGLALFQLESSAPALRRDGLTLETFWREQNESSQRLSRRSGSDISLRMGEGRGNLVGEWRYDESVLSAAAVHQLNSLLIDTLQRMMTSPCTEIELSIETPATRLTHGRAHDSLHGVARARRVGRGVPPRVAEDLLLDPAITPLGPGPIASPREARQILLTGATGFLGAFLLDQLLSRTTAEIVCLVRASDEVSAKRRVLKNLSRYSLSPSQAAERVRIVLGDLSQPMLGLAPLEYQRLASEIDVIYHNGADVNLVLPYESLRSTNVESVREVLRLAVKDRTKPVHLVSTFTVHTTAENRGQLASEVAPLPPFDKLLYGYSQTKWVSEQLAQIARQRGIPVTIYRPGHITGDSISGASNTGDLLHTIVLVCLELGAVPHRDVEFDVTPVDYVAKAIVELSLKPESAGGNFHLTNPNPMLTRELIEWMQQSHLGIEALPYEEWRERLLALGEKMGTNDMQLLTDVLGTRAFAEDDATAVHPRFDTSQTLALLAGSNITCPRADARLFDVYLSYLRRSAMVPARNGVKEPQSRTTVERTIEAQKTKTAPDR